jgi:hypothetical protein
VGRERLVWSSNPVAGVEVQDAEIMASGFIYKFIAEMHKLMTNVKHK